jgi:hypothetical protein
MAWGVGPLGLMSWGIPLEMMGRRVERFVSGERIVSMVLAQRW